MGSRLSNESVLDLLLHPDQVRGAPAMTRTLELSPDSLPELLPWLGVGLVLAQRELVMALWREEADG